MNTVVSKKYHETQELGSTILSQYTRLFPPCDPGGDVLCPPVSTEGKRNVSSFITASLSRLAIN